ncbi:MAG: hypothetical protein KA419_12715 [Acidobacteria bacterium]|nr:hypothetical protein [Acidobacteriota bacterium]
MIAGGLLSAGRGLPPETAVAGAPADRADVPELIKQGRWDEAETQARALLAADPGDGDATRWLREIALVDRWEVLAPRGKAVVPAQLWLRRHWIGLDFTPPEGPREEGFRWPLPGVEVKYKEDTAWHQPGYGVVCHGLEMKSGKEKWRVYTRFPFFEVISMQRRIRSWQVKAQRPDVPPPPFPAAVVKGKDTAGLKTTVRESIASGRWDVAEAGVQALETLSPHDPEVGALKAETAVVGQWAVRTWSPSDGYAGTLTLRKNWITFEGEDYGGSPDKPQRNDSFHFPRTALREASVCSERDYGAKAGSGGALDLVPGWASTVATGKNYGVELRFRSGEKSWKLILRGERNQKGDALGAAAILGSGVDPAR